MTDASKSPPRDTADTSKQASGPAAGWTTGQSWLPFVLPLLVYMLSGQLESTVADPTAWYPIIYSVRIVLTLAAMVVALPVYRTFPPRISPLAIGAGIVGVAVWVGVCRLNLEASLFASLENALPGDWGLGDIGGRAGYNPFEQLGNRPVALIGFLAMRFLGLALVVPIIEEFFLRGFLMRFVMQPDWWKLPVGAASVASWLAVIAYAALTHPAELIAAMIWFSLITLLVIRTKNIWDAVTAHAVTNVLLGVWILLTGDWRLW